MDCAHICVAIADWQTGQMNERRLAAFAVEIYFADLLLQR